jgi:type II secretory pathway component PulF
MSLILSPGQLARRAEFYYQLGSLTAAGLGLVPGLEQLARHPPARSYRDPIQHLLGHLAEGCTFTEALRSLKRPWLPQFDVALLHAGEQSGRLDNCLRLLAQYYTERANLARQLIAGLAYPAFIVHAAACILPFPDLFLHGDWLLYLKRVATVLVPLYVLAALFVFAAQARHGERWRALLEALLRHVPVLGAARRSLALARLTAALEALLSAGVTVIEAWEQAAAASGSPALHRAVLAWRPRVDGGQTPAETIAASGQFPELFTNEYAAGEMSGKLDETLQRLHQYYQEEGSRKCRALARSVPIIVYLAIVFTIAYIIIKSWSGIIQQFQNV